MVATYINHCYPRFSLSPQLDRLNAALPKSRCETTTKNTTTDEKMDKNHGKYMFFGDLS